MPYSQLSDDYYDRPEFLDLSRSALCLTTEAIVYSSRSLTDGYIPKNALRRISTSEDPIADAQELVAAGIWEELENGYQIPWDGQRTAEQIAEDREKGRIRKAVQRAHLAGDHSGCAEWKFCRKAKGSKVSHPDSAPESSTESTPESADQSTPLHTNAKHVGVSGSGGSDGSASPPPPVVGASRTPASAPSSEVVEKSAPKDPRLEGIEDLLGPL
ncbi:hypothetical protein [Rhodococcus sp. IEGM 1330]|uniref:hypothetical protein n=1 Tax=Rhodococcus sp. IEGM 1330 TaxID=3082225 RepID=UPI002953E175|nr:hypothetical protein [Rhodococcus sp. IEGM 1330]MDV8022504.1 hypothetical protein [Rhodococcus sp. IEGM 1330]